MFNAAAEQRIKVDEGYAFMSGRETTVDDTADMRWAAGLGTSEMAKAIRLFPWHETSLGLPTDWPLSLLTSLRLVLNTSQPICLWWGPSLLNFHNDAYAPMLGGRRDQALGRPARELWPDVWPDVQGLVDEALAGRSTRMVDLPLVMTRNGYAEPTNWSFSYSPVFDDAGHVAGMMNIVVDTTATVQTRTQLNEALENAKQHIARQQKLEETQRALQAELAHRLKNTLAMTQAIVSQSLRAIPSAREAASTIGDRLIAMARAQDVLVQGGEAGMEIMQLLDEALQPHRDRDGRFDLEGPNLYLQGQRALGLSLALHELATNALKYGALSTEGGTIVIRWSVMGDRFNFEWTEHGGPPPAPRGGAGFGSQLTERIVPSYFRGQGKTVLATSGARYTLTGDLGTLDGTSDVFDAF